MQGPIQINPLCCGRWPIMDTWDKNECRSILCSACGKHTKSYFCRYMAVRDWKEGKVLAADAAGDVE